MKWQEIQKIIFKAAGPLIWLDQQLRVLLNKANARLQKTSLVRCGQGEQEEPKWMKLMAPFSFIVIGMLIILGLAYRIISANANDFWQEDLIAGFYGISAILEEIRQFWERAMASFDLPFYFGMVAILAIIILIVGKIKNPYEKK